MTKKEYVSDIVLQVTQGSISADTEIEESQVAFWLGYELARLQRIEIDAELRAGRKIPAVYLVREACKVLTTEDTDCADECEDRVYVTLTGEVLDVHNDRGIVYVETDEGDEVKKSSTDGIGMLKHLPFAKPSIENLQYYRQGSNIFIQGFRPTELDDNKVHVTYVPKQNVSALADDDEVVMSDQIERLVLDSVVERLKLQLYGSQPDKSNDGVDTKDTLYHNVLKDRTKLETPE